MERALEIDELLRHAGWLRKLAANLVRDPGRAEELVQETWLAALRNPPRASQTARPWLARVFQNLARNRRRDELTRAGHEARATPRSPGPRPDEIAAELEAQRLLAEAVARLAEPARTIVVLRYFRGLDASAIGRELALPSGTVRWKLSAALEDLRFELDRRCEGGRRAWSLLLARVLARGAPPAAASTLPWLAATAAVLVFAGWWSVRRNETLLSVGAGTAATESADAERTPAALARPTTEPETAAQTEPSARVPATLFEPTTEPARDEPDLSGRVRLDGQALTAPLTLEVFLGDGSARSLSTDESGNFELYSLEHGLGFTLRAPRYRRAGPESDWRPLTGTVPQRGLELEFLTPPALRGRAVDERGEPVPDAHGSFAVAGTASDWILDSGSLPFDCDGEGRFEIRLLALMEEHMPKFLAEERLEATLVFEAPRAGRRVLASGPLSFADHDLGDVVLERVRGLAFRVRDERGQPLSGAVARIDDHWLAQPSNPTNDKGFGELRYAPERAVKVRFSALGFADRVLAVDLGETPDVSLERTPVLEVQLEPPQGNYEPFPQVRLTARGQIFSPPDFARPFVDFEIDRIQVELGASHCFGSGSTTGETGPIEWAFFVPDSGGRCLITGLRPAVPFTIEIDPPRRTRTPKELMLASGEHKRVTLAYE
jgi:RNA polymerase sigma-70 factor (ECF subfamily)